MSQKSLDDLGDLQRAAMEAVWGLGEASVHQVRDCLKKKRLAYTTVLTTLQNLEKAGWLRHRAEGKSYVYTPTRSRAEAGRKSLQKMMKRVFDGDAKLMFQHLIQSSDLSDEDLVELRSMINRKRKGELDDE